MYNIDYGIYSILKTLYSELRLYNINLTNKKLSFN